VKEMRYYEVFDTLFSQIFYQLNSIHQAGLADLEQRLREAEWSPDPEAAFQRIAGELVEEYLQARDFPWATSMQWIDLIANRIIAQAGLAALPGMGGGNLSGMGSGGQLWSAVRRQIAAYQYRQKNQRDLFLPDDSPLRQLSFNQASPEQQQQMHRLIRRLARKIANRAAGIKKAGGRDRLNFRRLWRRSLSTGGIPVELSWERPPKRKSRLFVLLDVSRSMRSTVSFFLEFLFALYDEFSNIRAFLFVNSLTEVTQIIDKDDLADTVNRIVEKGGSGLSGLTDYGESLVEFSRYYLEELTGKTTVIILGDARNNYFPAREEALTEIRRKCAGLLWLNPEPTWQWGFGDSYMNVYRPYCDQVFECRNLEQMEHFIEQLVLRR
ncbi:MAG: VWA domain-containing protein, partial [Syntrophomonadaceae bacterium]|nr:VWA domain-containing protein [Syntrophomonadaceae bacterium]